MRIIKSTILQLRVDTKHSHFPQPKIMFGILRKNILGLFITWKSLCDQFMKAISKMIYLLLSVMHKYKNEYLCLTPIQKKIEFFQKIYRLQEPIMT